MKKQQLWFKFCISGRIKDYLEYKKTDAKECDNVS